MNFAMVICRFVVLFGLAFGTAHAAPQENQYSDLDAYWKHFRQAVLSNNRDQLAELTRFPLRVRGTTDLEAEKKIGKAEFPRYIDLLLKQPIYSTASGGGMQSRTLYQMVKEQESLPKKAKVAVSSARFEQFEFALVGGRWLLVRAYLEE